MAVNQKTNGRWQVDVKKPDAKRYRATFDTEQEALDAERAYLGGLALPNVTTKGYNTMRMRFEAACCERWPETKSKPREYAEWALDNFFGWERYADTVTLSTISEYKAFCRNEKGNGENTINKKISAVNEMFAVGLELGLIDKPLKAKFKKLKKNGRKRILTNEEEQRIYTFVRSSFGVEWGLYFTILLEPGMRTGEAGKLLWKDVNLAKGIVNVWDAKGDARVVPISNKAMSAFEEVKPYGSERVFPNWTQDKLNKSVWYCVRTLFDDQSTDFVPHCYRHTTATRLLHSGVLPVVVQRWMGHKNILTTMGYYHFSEAQFAPALEAFNQRDMSPDI